MTKYRLPEALGGGEVKLVRWESGHSHAVVVVDDVGEVHVPLVLLTRVVPAAPPPEPPVGSVVRALLPDEDEGWIFEHAEGRSQARPWYGAGRDEGYTWSDLCARETPVAYVPDPFAEPVELPWSRCAVKFSSIGPAEVTVEPFRPLVRILARPFGDGEWRLSPPIARQMARALWAAADAVEATP